MSSRTSASPSYQRHAARDRIGDLRKLPPRTTPRAPGREHVATPLRHVAVHVEQAERVGAEGADRGAQAITIPQTPNQPRASNGLLLSVGGRH